MIVYVQALAKDLPWKLKESRVLEILQAVSINFGTERTVSFWLSLFRSLGVCSLSLLVIDECNLSSSYG